jgi:hypothetical protein
MPPGGGMMIRRDYATWRRHDPLKGIPTKQTMPSRLRRDLSFVVFFAELKPDGLFRS